MNKEYSLKLFITKIAYILLASLIMVIALPNFVMFSLLKIADSGTLQGLGSLIGAFFIGIICLIQFICCPVSESFRFLVATDDLLKVQVPLSVTILDLLIWFSIFFIIVHLHEKKML